MQTVMRSSYLHHYRRIIPVVLETIRFQSNNTKHRPVLDGIELLIKYKDSKQQTYPEIEIMPVDGVVRKDWMSLIYTDEMKVNRANYELALLNALRTKLKCKEIWAESAFKYGNPDRDLPNDFNQNRSQYFDKLGLQKSSKRFTQELKLEMSEALSKFDKELPANPKVKIIERKGQPHIRVSTFEPQTPPPSLQSLKSDLQKKWPMTGLLDVLKETELRTEFTKNFETVGISEKMGKDKLQRRLILTLFGLGTNMGLKRVCTTTTGENPQDLVYVKRKYINRDNLRNAIAKVSNEILKVRMAEIWGESTTSCASDSKKFGSWDQNLLTEWHIRYRGRGVMIYWHVDKKSLCIYSQLKSCSSSEVSSMLQGLLSHNTNAEIEKNYVDSHGQSEVAFAFCSLLGFQLMPRLKAIHTQKLSLPDESLRHQLKNVNDILKSKPINWELIEQQYDEMVKHIAALKLGYADAETILKRFTRNNEKHPTYKAFKELGRAYKTIFLCQYLGSESLRMEINEGLNVVENWNSANSFVFFGKNGEISTNNIAEQEVSVLALHLLQISMVYINTIMIQQIAKDNEWLEDATIEDLRAITPLIYEHINPYGTFNLDMENRLEIAA